MENLDNLKYNELRKLAKQLGIKANRMKADKLIKALQNHYDKEGKRTDVGDTDFETKELDNLSETESSSNECVSQEMSSTKPAPRGGRKAKRGAKTKSATKAKLASDEKVQLKIKTLTMSGEAKTMTPVQTRPNSLNNTPSSRPLSMSNAPKHLRVLTHVTREPLGARSRRSYTPKSVSRLSGVSKSRLSTPSLSGNMQERMQPSWFLSPKEIMKRQSASTGTPNTTAGHPVSTTTPKQDHPVSAHRRSTQESENTSQTESSSNECVLTAKPVFRGGKKAKRGAKKKTATKAKSSTDEQVQLKITTTTLSGEAEMMIPVETRRKSLNNTSSDTPSSRPLNREPLGAGSRRSYTPKSIGRISGVSKPRLSTPSFTENTENGIRPSWFLTPKEIMKRQSASTGTPNTTAGHPVSPSTPKQDHPVSAHRRSTQSVTDACDPGPEKTCLAGNGKITRQSKRRSGNPAEVTKNCAPDRTKGEINESVIGFLDKTVKDQIKNDPHKTSIPMFAEFFAKKKENEKSNRRTPDWSRIQKKEFDEFDSIDVFVNKKRKRADDITASVKKARMMLEEVHAAVDRLKSHEAPNKKQPSLSFMSPVMKESMKTPNAFKSIVASTKHFKTTPRPGFSQKRAPFRPTMTSTQDIDLNFSNLKMPTVGTKKSPRNSGTRRSTGSYQTKKSIGTTPARFNASMNTSLNTSVSRKPVFDLQASLARPLNTSVSRKPVFDLQASLARPITWTTHKGKLNRLDHRSSTEFVNTSIKTPITQTREDRRSEAMKQRADKKFNAEMARRGILV